MNGSIIHHHENSNDKINAGIRVREKHSQYCFACIYNRQIKKFPTEKQNVSLKHILT